MPLALVNKEFYLVYQPQIDTTTNKIIGAEALIRWKHPLLGDISPCEFIPIVEETPQVVPLGHWVLKEACLQLKIWHTFGYQNLKISVNLSAKEFQQNQLIENISQILNDVQVDPKHVTLELTERIAMINEKKHYRD